MNFWTFPNTKKINGPQLIKELGCNDVYTSGDQLIIVGDLSEQQAIDGLAAHVAQPTQFEIDEALKTAAKTNLIAGKPLTPEQAERVVI